MEMTHRHYYAYYAWVFRIFFCGAAVGAGILVARRQWGYAIVWGILFLLAVFAAAFSAAEAKRSPE